MADVFFGCERGKVGRGGVCHIAVVAGRVVRGRDLRFSAIPAGGSVPDLFATMNAVGHRGDCIVFRFASMDQLEW